MRLLKTHSHTSERPGYEARKNAKKVIEGNVDTIRQTICQNLPRTANVAGGERDEKGAMARPTTVKTLPRTVSVAGGRDEERRIEEHALRQGKPTSNPSRRLPSWRLDETKKAKTNTKMERWHNLQSREGGGVPS